jgi:hypothetical protein
MPEVAWTLRFAAGGHLPTCLTGKSAMACPALFAKIFLFPFGANHLFILAIPAHAKGAFRDRHERKVGMRWTRWHQGRVVLFADGEVVWS